MSELQKSSPSAMMTTWFSPAVRVITKSPFDTSSNLLLNKLKWEKLSIRRQKQKALIMYKTMRKLAQEYLQRLFIQRHAEPNLRTLELLYRGQTCSAQTTNELSKTKFLL